MSDELASFRQEWAEELYKDDEYENDSSQESISQLNAEEEKAFQLFLKATYLEKEGDFNAAVYFYREAIRLCPNVEETFAEYQRQQYLVENKAKEDEGKETENNSVDLQEMIQQLTVLHVTGLCVPKLPQTETHISSLPTELLMVIIKWVVSKDLDIRSIGYFSRTCKWFYACFKDEELWKLICQRAWGITCGKPKQYGNSWQKMFVQRPHLKFDGVYISENTYVHFGVASVDSFYKPIKLVVYYKVFRFFPDGRCAILVSTDEPKQAIQGLKSPPFRDPYLDFGYYRMVSEQTVNIYFTRETKPSKMEFRQIKKRNRNAVLDVREQNFFMQLKLENTKKSHNNKLSWENYHCTIKRSSTGTTSENEIDWKQFKPFIFSRVKSYTSQSTSCLGV